MVRYRDTSTVQERLQAMGFAYMADGELDNRAKACKDVMKHLDYKVNKNQMGVALYAAYILEKKDNLRQIISVPAGQGKSRIIVAIIRLLASRKGSSSILTKVQVVYNHQQLLDQDRDKITRVCKNSDIRLTFTVPNRADPVIQMTDKELVIIDEADHILLDRAVHFQNLRATSLIIGLTATLKEDLLDCEKGYVVDDLKFAYVDSNMTASIADRTPAVSCSMERFMSAE